MTNTILSDYCQSFIFKNLHVRGNIVKFTNLYQDIVNLQDINLPTAHLLGQALAAAAMLVQPLKNIDNLTLQFQSQDSSLSKIKLLAVKIDSENNVRATINCDKELSEAKLGQGFLVVTLIQKNNPEPHQSIIAIHNNQTISQALSQYFAQSEQMPSLFYFSCSDEKATGIMLQQTKDLVDPEDWNTLCHLFNTITDKELLDLSCENILTRLFNQFDLELFPEKELRFKCSCSLEKMQNALMSMSKAECLEILETHQVIEVLCEYCKNNYRFYKDDVERIFSQH